MADNPSYELHKVAARYPRLNKPTTWVRRNGSNKRIDCEVQDDGAHYSMDVVLTKEKAIPLYKEMKATYEERKGKDWPDFEPSSKVFEAGENDGEFIITTKIPAAYNKKPTWVVQFDSHNNELPTDFLLTTGSVINVAVNLYVYDPRNVDGCGVSLRLRQVQVEKLAELKRRSRFEKVEGGFNSKSEGFATSLFSDDDTDGEDDDFDEPKAKAKPVEDFDEPKAKVKEEPKEKAKEVEDFDDIDKALDNLDFED
jgi:hypothetical protein